MINIFCKDDEGFYEISIKSFDYILFKRNLKKKEFQLFLIPEGKWYRTTEAEYENLCNESEIEDTKPSDLEFEMDMDLEDDEPVDECEVEK
ncbi:MAG: hypothetical protein WC055_00635 [Melioribacteraceae bacterium]